MSTVPVPFQPGSPQVAAPPNSPADGAKTQLLDDLGRPKEFTMTIQGGMLEALGINMYTSIGKCLVEFLANSYDSEAKGARVTVPFERIAAARQEMRTAARLEVQQGERDKFSVLLEPLPEDIVITISDDGHGMSATDIQAKFLPLNRNRRLDDEKKQTVLVSENKLRHVMGRKGLGKLAGFGAAESVTVRSKRKGETYATEFTMYYQQIKDAPNVSEASFRPVYIENQSVEQHGTTVTLNRLRCDAMKSGRETIISSLQENFFGISPADYSIYVNEEPIGTPNVDYEFEFPPERDADGFARTNLDLEDLGSLELRYVVRFRARPKDHPPVEGDVADGRERGSLSARQRGARIYCNNRLALGPSMLDVHSGVHNFRSSDYMECIVHADELDRHSIDFVNTNRTELRRDNEIVDKLHTTVSELMKKAMSANYAFRSAKVEAALAGNLLDNHVLQVIELMPRRSQVSAKKVLAAVAQEHGVHSDRFKEAAPLLLQAMNAGDVLTKLIELGHDPKSLHEVTRTLHELTLMEQRDVLKIYRARRNGIAALRKLIERGDEKWLKSPFFEKDLHQLVKDNAWLIRPEYSRYLSSDQPMGDVAKMLSRELGVDESAPAKTNSDSDDHRPDLVFVLAEGGDPPTSVVVAEFKSPNVPLRKTHLDQLERYLFQIRDLIRNEYGVEGIQIRGHLIGAMPAQDTKVVDSKQLLRLIEEGTLPRGTEVTGLQMMLERTKKVHLEAINALREHDDVEDETK